MGRTRQLGTWYGAPLLLLLGALQGASSARAQDAAPPPTAAPVSAPAPVVEETPTRCGDRRVGTGEGELRPLGQGFLADGARVRRGCTLILQRPLRERSAVPFSPESFKPLGCGFFRSANSIYWHRPLSPDDTQEVPGGERADVLSRLDLADAATFELVDGCRARDARFFYLDLTATPFVPAFVAVPRDEGAGYEELGCGYVRHSGRVFFGVRLIEGAHAPSFTSVQGRLPHAECGEGLYGKDRTRVWWRDELVRGASARVFRVPREENPGLRVACAGRRSFQHETVDKKPDPLCRGAKKPKPSKKKR